MSETEPETVDAPAPAPAQTLHDEDDRLKSTFVDAVIACVEEGDVEGARALVRPLHPADVADLFELAPQDMRRPLATALAEMLDGDVLAEMNEWVRDELIDALAPHEVAEIATQLDTDDAVAIIEELEEEEQRAVLRAMEPDDRAAIEEALSYPEESAGRLMQRDLIAVPEHWTVGDVLDYLRSNEDLTTDFWEVFVVDAGHHPIGTCKLSWLMRTPRRIAIGDVMQREQTLIPVDMDQEEVALRFQKYALISAAVVDPAGRLVGMITVDDIVHIIQEEAGEDILKLSGAGDGDINEPILQTVRVRLTWLIVNLGTAVIAASVVGLFQGTIAKLVVLAVLMPIVSGMGGNAGTQTMAVAVRALALNQLTSSNTARMILREFRIAITNGLCIGGLLGISVYLIYGNADLGIVICLAMIINNITAGLAGILVPVGLDKAGADPAVSSAVFVTTATDVMGFFSFLGLAALWGLHG
ncbi:magnesium transporter [Rhizorhabdus wittichii]|jgi:magnesium transporter|uniref:Magnesium transporter MgtE n=1 Tax=Rhizorhabdus wittichii TaxID=160791 RepID=A0A975CY78_9SPHN|nr:magnesium transporter [Rhizorhabdus wittichii]ARR53143.1 magnesium transporter [Rhizorhabdus wittichii DC-6]QTH19517.1 magnesium transporter [Rhizorhabdus wittichii]